MTFADEYKVSAVPLDYPFALVTGQEARDYLNSQGYSFVHTDDVTGSFQAMSPRMEPLHKSFLYKRQRFVSM